MFLAQLKNFFSPKTVLNVQEEGSKVKFNPKFNKKILPFLPKELPSLFIPSGDAYKIAKIPGWGVKTQYDKKN